MSDRFTRGYEGKRHHGERIATATWDAENGECDVTIAPLFDELSDVEKLDALNDAIGLLEREYDIILEIQRAKYEAKLAAKEGSVQ